ncbi:MAG: glycoside hydrolase family 13 protein [Chloroflexi bacterium]|nr:glycoside hydrolase family 13 protein [Chloroflexota bacterium]
MHTTQFVPQWAKGIIWYQIFPERFRNGDPHNDPTLDSIAGSWPHNQTPPWQVHPWTSDWYKLQPYEQTTGLNLWHNIQRRRYGGDIQGILDSLDYLQELGVEALYLNPVFMAPSAHKYDGATYHHIDPYFGPDPAGDLALMAQENPADPSTWLWTAADKLMLKLIAEVHERGLRIVFDGVFNHMGINSWAFRDVVAQGLASPYADWFKVQRWEPFTYEGWFGVPDLPEIRQDENGTVAGPRDYVFAATRRWLDPDGDGDPRDGIDGWRLDVAFCVRHPFWKAWRQFVRSINPEAYLVAEMIGTLEEQGTYLQGDEFDAIMHYDFAYACADFFISQPRRITASQFEAQLRDLRDAYPTEVAYVMQNLFGSHDTQRLPSHVVNRNLPYRHWGDDCHWHKVENNAAYDTRQPTPAERQIQKLVVLMQMTYPGAPMIYYGDEAGMWGANDPCCRKPMVWRDLAYEPETTLPDGSPRPTPDEVTFDEALFASYQQLIRLRRQSPALRLGDYQTLLTDDARCLFAFARRYEEEEVLVVLNADERGAYRRITDWWGKLGGTAEWGRVRSGRG